MRATGKNRRRTRKPFSRCELLEQRTLLAAGIGVFDPATDTFSLRNQASAGPADAEFQLSAPGTLPVVGDWNGDHQDDFGVFDPATATWSLRYGAEDGDPNAGVFQFGQTGSIPVVGDWNGDGRDDIGTFKAGTWTLRHGASPGLADAGTFSFGAADAQPVVGDWNGDGIDGIGVRTTATRWNLNQTASATATSAGSFLFGPAGVAVVGDWNGDGRDGIGVYEPAAARFNLRQTANAGAADAGVFVFGDPNLMPVAGKFTAPPAPEDALATIHLPPINLDLLGVEINTSPITVHLSSEQGDGKLLGNLLNTASTLVDLDGASQALNTVLDSTVDLLNSADLLISAGSGELDNATAGNQQVLELFVAPVHLDLLGVLVDTSPIRVTINAHSGEGLILGNAVTTLINLFNPPLPEDLDIDFLNTKIDELLMKLHDQLPGIAPAPVDPVPISDGQILNVTVPPLDVNLLGLKLETSPITINASAETGDGLLVGNVLTTALKTLDATPENLSELNTNINGILAKVVGVLNSADLILGSGVVDALPPALQTLLGPGLTAPAEGASAPILDLLIASPDGTSPPVNVDLLGLVVTTSNIEAHLSAVTGDGLVLGNLLYNLANLADPGGPAGLLNLLDILGAGNLDDSGDTTGGSVTPTASPPEELLTLTVKPLEIDLLGLELKTEPIVVHLGLQDGDGKLLGNLLTGITTLINVDGLSAALNNVLSATVELVNSASLLVDGVGSGTFDTAEETVTPILDLFVAPVHLDLLGLVADTEPIHLTLTAHSGQGRVLGNIVKELANVFNPPLPDKLDIDFINERLAALIDRVNDQIPLIPPAETPPVTLDEDQFLELTVPALDLDLLGLLVQSQPITVNAFAEEGNGLLLGNVLTTVLNTVDATTENLTGLNTNLNALLAKVVGVLNASSLVLSGDALGILPSVLQTLASPLLIADEPGATTEILDLLISSDSAAGPPVDVDLLGLNVSTSNIEAHLLAQTGDGKLLGNLLYNAANLLNDGLPTSLLSILAQLGSLTPIEAPKIVLGGTVPYLENAVGKLLAPSATLYDITSADFALGQLTVAIAENRNLADRIEIVNQGTAAGQIGVSTSQVTFGGVVIGSFSGGFGDSPLVVSLNSSATVDSVEALLRNLTFRTLSDAPSEALRTITFELSDGDGFVSNLATKFVSVTGINDAPLLNALLSPVLTTISEDATNPAGNLISSLLAGVTDPDAGALRGIAVTAASNFNGAWQFSLNGGDSWQAMGAVSGSAARLLPGWARVRFLPKADFNGTVKLFFHAWDQTSGSAGGTLNLAGNVGGTKSISVANESASLTVTPVNDAPALALSGTIGYVHDTAAITLAPSATVSDIDSANFANGRLRVRITDGASSSNRLAIGAAFTVDADNNVRQGTTIIGKRVANGFGTNELVVTFNANTKPSVVQQLVRAITFKTVGGAAGQRKVVFTVSDGDGGLSGEAVKTVNVS
jgi:hypothetical protein